MRYLAFIDILGFKNIINNYEDKINELGNMLHSKFIAAIYAAISEKTINIEEVEKNAVSISLPDEIKYYQFSDSVIFYTDSDRIDRFEKIVRTLNILMARCIFEGLPLRGALVKGDVFVKPPIIIGKPLVDAYNLEEQQEWAGIIVDKSCYEKDNEKNLLHEMLSKKLLVETDVPVKCIKQNNSFFSCNRSNCNNEQIAINWPQFCGLYLSRSDNDFFKKFFMHTCGCKEFGVLNKYYNTYNFLMKNIGSMQLPHFAYKAIIMKLPYDL